MSSLINFVYDKNNAHESYRDPSARTPYGLCQSSYRCLAAIQGSAALLVAGVLIGSFIPAQWIAAHGRATTRWRSHLAPLWVLCSISGLPPGIVTGQGCGPRCGAHWLLHPITVFINDKGAPFQQSLNTVAEDNE